MKKMQSTIDLLVTALFLVACDQNTSPISDEKIKSTDSVVAENANIVAEFSVSTLDDVITVKLPSSFFQQDANSPDSINIPEHAKLEGLFHDAISNIGFHLVNHGKTNKNAEQYSQDLDKSIKKQDHFENINIELKDNQQINYQYTITTADSKLNESCVAIIKDNLYSACAFSDNQDFAALNNTLKQISVKAD